MSEPTTGPTDSGKTLSREQLLGVLGAEPVFDFTSQVAGVIHVTPMLVNTLEKIVFEFERSDADDNSKLRRLLREIGQTDNETGQLGLISKILVDEVTDEELADFARKLLVSEEWASEKESIEELDPKGRVVKEIRKGMEAPGAAYKKMMDSLGSSISAATRASILDSSLIADRLRTSAFASSYAMKAMEEESRIAKLGRSIAQMSKPFPGVAAFEERTRGLKGTLPGLIEPAKPLPVSPFPNFVNPAIESARSTAESAANLEKAFERLEQRANDSAAVIAGIHDIIRNTTLDMAKNAQESSAATKQSLDQAAASVAIGVQSLNWAKYALIASVVIGMVGLVLSSVSAWYAVPAPPQLPQPAIQASPNTSTIPPTKSAEPPLKHDQSTQNRPH
ncbi:hypothetical protein [Caballeronia sordidicola]|uniref:Uncharacterized protein n=1 Tax=Caballeronia sordidicola TaxID=196367 RepID=A0A242MS90_CABSO|nr:hypothetical protein [Caballeronia sordidicola]OTP70434.1 hypothetical protein PAMC26510_25540 [Caballeronia sordidicola]OTP74144.1 hypothetical protein PAMC26510_17300 [Caballeronia sordidicola]